MKNVVTIVRWVVGLLFIFSGLIKVNDPLGLSYKMQEFFDVWGITFMDKFSLGLSIMMNMLEVGCGVALLIGFKIKLTIRILLTLIVFFTFLTGYALLSGKIKTCGCLGDCLPLTPAMSFIKDLILLALIVFITFNQKEVTPSFSQIGTSTILMFSIIICIFLQDAVLNYLPYIDCLPFKVGNSIITQMQKSKDYVPDSTVITYQYKKGGKAIEFDQNNFPADFDSTYEYVNRYDKLIRKGSGGANITDFNLITLSGTDTTLSLFATPKYVLVMGNSFPQNLVKWFYELQQMKTYCTLNHISLFYVTSQPDEEIKKLTKEGITVLKCDGTVIKTAARVNTTYFLMNHATIFGKYSDRDLNKIKMGLNELKSL